MPAKKLPDAGPDPSVPAKFFGSVGCLLSLVFCSAVLCVLGFAGWNQTAGWRRSFTAHAPATATGLPPRPATYTPVNDGAGLLTSAEADSLGGRLRGFAHATSTQVVIVTVPSLNGYEIADFAQRLYHDWGIGQRGNNNGLLVLVARQEHQMRIQPGYGLEGAIPDAIAKRLITNVLTPAFQAKRYYAGLDALATQLMQLAQGETASFLPPEPNTDLAQLIPYLEWVAAVSLLLLLLVLFRYGSRGLWRWVTYAQVVRSTGGKRSASRGSSWSSSSDSSSSSSSSSGGNDSSSSSDSWGGGDSGGGGASGSW